MRSNRDGGGRFTVKALIDRALSSIVQRMDRAEARTAAVERGLQRLQTAIGRIEARQLYLGRPAGAGPLAQHEFSVFSQWGEDGIIAWLVREVAVERKVFIEFGVEDYSEANTRFLAEHDNWTGLVLDANPDNIDRIRSSEVCWRHNISAIAALITRDNINSLITRQGISGDIGLLSIDIDGNDYWVWQAIDAVNPEIVVIEYNHRFGDQLAVTIPYNENFRRGEQHPNIYFGASLRALALLGSSKGYAFVGCNSNGVNAFFVRRDRMPQGLKELTVEEGYVAGTFTENRDEHGLFVPAQADEERRLVTSLPLVDVSETQKHAG
jgi:hypothetical protein